jgi:hypothetical protein
MTSPNRAYQTSDQVYAVFGELWRRLLTDRRPLPVTVSLTITDPPAAFLLAHGDVRLGAHHDPADVEVALDAETAHRIWTNRLSIGEAAIRGLVKARGRTALLMQQLPALLQPSHAIYAELCRAHGIPSEET